MKKDNSQSQDFNEKNRIIHVSGLISENSARDVTDKLICLDAMSPRTDILMMVDSYGGYVDSFIAMHDVMKMITSDVVTVCIGKAMSCGQMILMSGTKGKRFITPNSRVMIHEISSVTGGKLSEVENDYRELQRMQTHVVEKLILKYTKINKKTLANFMMEDTYLSADDCVKYGVVDYVITSPSVLYKRIKM